MIHGYVRAGQTDEAMDIYSSMQRSGHEAYSGWLAITKQLFAAGQQGLARQLVRSRQSDWLPDADLYEGIIKSVCSDFEENRNFYMPSRPNTEAAFPDEDGATPATPSGRVDEALNIVREVQVWASHAWNCLLLLLQLCGSTPQSSTLTRQPETFGSPFACACLWVRHATEADFCAAQKRLTIEVRHMNPLLELCAATKDATTAETLVEQMIAGQYAAPNVSSMELLAEVHYCGCGSARRLCQHICRTTCCFSDAMFVHMSLWAILAVSNTTSKLSVCVLVPNASRQRFPFLQAIVRAEDQEFDESLYRLSGLVSRARLPLSKKYKALLVEGALNNNQLQASSLICFCFPSSFDNALSSLLPFTCLAGLFAVDCVQGFSHCSAAAC